ncbi:MAG: hydroxyethylthiazole kinase [Halanaerobiales bacterium]
MNIEEILNEISKCFELLKQRNPLVHQITNYVAANDQANITLAAGGRPIMAEHPAELKDILSSADSLLINIGTLTERKEKVLIQAAELAAAYNVPVVLDPVGVAGSRLRKSVALQVIEKGNIAIVKGNKGEIFSIFDICSEKCKDDNKDNKQDKKQANNQGNNSSYKQSSGVDFIGEFAELSRDKTIRLKGIAESQNLVIVITGEKDIIIDRTNYIEMDNGSPIFNNIAGAGCMTGSLIASYLSVSQNPITAALTGLSVMGIAGEIAEKNFVGPGSFRVNLMDQVAALNIADIISNTKITTK